MALYMLLLMGFQAERRCHFSHFTNHNSQEILPAVSQSSVMIHVNVLRLVDE